MVATHPKVIAFEGLLGVGKSTLIKALSQAKTHTTTTFDEHINSLFLTLFYADTKRYAFAFQYGMLKSRLYQWQLAHTLRQQKTDAPQWHLWDRSMLGDFVFATANAKTGSITDGEMAVYEHEFGTKFENIAQSRYVRDMDVIVLLVDTPARCKARVESVRKNESEKAIPLAYYERLDALHFQLFYNLWKGENVPPIVVANWEDLNDVPALETRITYAALQKKQQAHMLFDQTPPGTFSKNAYMFKHHSDIEKYYDCIKQYYDAVGSTHISSLWLELKRYASVYLPDPPNGEASEALRHVVYFFLSRGTTVHFYNNHH